MPSPMRHFSFPGHKDINENWNIAFCTVSDDNSSMQSSPWQRDHSWKQNRPCRNISSEMNLYFWKPKIMRLGRKRRKRRSPYCSSSDFKNDYTTQDEHFDKTKKKYGKKSLMAIIQTLIDKNFQIRYEIKYSLQLILVFYFFKTMFWYLPKF